MSHRELSHLSARHVGLRDHLHPERPIMGPVSIADDLDPLHRSCLSGCHSGSLICSVHHEAKNAFEKGFPAGSGRDSWVAG